MAWLALVAIWLTALAPTVSRTVEAAFVFPDLGAWCEATPTGHHGERHDDTNTDAACGYCTLFAQAPALGGAFFIGHVLPLAGLVAAGLPLPRAIAPVAIVHASPRGPPIVAHA